MSIGKKYYTIKEVAEILQVTTSSLRFWEKEIDKLKPAKRGRNLVRVYTDKDISILQVIYTLVRKEKMSIKKVNILLNEKQQLGGLLSQDLINNRLLMGNLMALQTFFTQLYQSIDTETKQ